MQAESASPVVEPALKSVGAVSRQAILDTAARLFRQEGYAATSLRAIADACNMKAGSLYYHFASKDQIVSEVLDIGVQRVFDAVQGAVEALGPESSLKATLQCAIEAHLRALLQAHDFTSANIRIFGQVPADVRAAHKDLRKRYEQYWRDLLADLQHRGDIGAQKDLQRTVLFLFGAMNWATEWYDEKKSDLGSVAEELADLLAHGLQAPAP
jgi:TetR/AcrR family transcriptional regulator, cholesterol catabolism regulator